MFLAPKNGGDRGQQGETAPGEPGGQAGRGGLWSSREPSAVSQKRGEESDQAVDQGRVFRAAEKDPILSAGKDLSCGKLVCLAVGIQKLKQRLVSPLSSHYVEAS